MASLSRMDPTVWQLSMVYRFHGGRQSRELRLKKYSGIGFSSVMAEKSSKFSWENQTSKNSVIALTGSTGEYPHKSSKVIDSRPDREQCSNPEEKHPDIVHVDLHERMLNPEEPVIIVMQEQANYGYNLEDCFEFAQIASRYHNSLA